MGLFDRVRSVYEDFEVEDGSGRGPANVDPLQEAVDKQKGTKFQERKISKLDAETLEERRKLRESKQLESRLKFVSDLVEVQKGMQELNQAKLDFYQMESQASLNKTLIDQEIDEIVGAGQAQAGLERAKGETASELSQLKLAAQGQSLSGEGAKAVSQSQKILAATRAADARSNALSRAMGLELEKVAIDRQVAYGDIQKRLAYESGFTRMAFGIADAAIRYRGGAKPGESKKKETEASATSGGTYNSPGFSVGGLNSYNKAMREGSSNYKKATKKKKASNRGPASIRRPYWIAPFDPSKVIN